MQAKIYRVIYVLSPSFLNTSSLSFYAQVIVMDLVMFTDHDVGDNNAALNNMLSLPKHDEDHVIWQFPQKCAVLNHLTSTESRFEGPHSSGPLKGENQCLMTV